MAPRIEFGYFAPTGSARARGQNFSPALQRAIDIARHGFTSVWFADHFMFGDADIHEAWVLLSYAAALAPELQLGHLVLCNSYRPPSLVAKMSASLQALSGGRFVLGYGAGWKKDEYEAYGLPVPACGDAHRHDGRRNRSDQGDVARRAGHVLRRVLPHRQRAL